MDLCNLGEVRRLLEKYGTAPKKGFGQNFLINPMIPERIAEASAEDAAPHACALEIGPGIGVLTKELSAVYEKVTALEIDRALWPLLEETLGDCDNVTVVGGDVMQTDVPALISEHFGDRPVHVCANLPYYITTPVLMKLLDEVPASASPRIHSVTVMVQNEVAARICAAPGSDAYGALSVAIAFRGRAEKLFTVSAGNFFPAPKVASAVVRINLYENGPASVFPELKEAGDGADALFEKAQALCQAAFNMRRKTLTNALGGLYDKNRVAEALESMGLRTDVRGEKLSAEEMVRLTAILEAV